MVEVGRDLNRSRREDVSTAEGSVQVSLFPCPLGRAGFNRVGPRKAPALGQEKHEVDADITENAVKEFLI